MKTAKKTFIVLLGALVLIASSCTKKDSATATTGSSASHVSKTPIEFSIFSNFDNMVFNPDWRIWQEIAKTTNVSLKSVVSQANSSEREAFNLMLSSGKLADIICYADAAELEKLGRDGGLISLNSLIKEHAPNIQKLLDTSTQFSSTANSLDGNIYYIPKHQTLKFSQFYWIRADWLEKLDLTMPSTLDELYVALSAFRNRDPNGNGKKDEIPLFDRAGNKAPDEYLYLWDTSTDFYVRDGKIVFDPMQPEFILGTKEFTKWYKEGIVDPEFFTRGAKSRDILLSSNLGAFTHDWISTGNYNNTLAKDLPGFKMVGMLPPKDPYGNIILRDARADGTGWGISSQCKDPVTLIKFFDFFFTQQGSDMINWGLEGETYTRNEQGVKQFKDIVLLSEQTPIGYLRSLGVQYRIGMAQDGQYELDCMSSEAKAIASQYSANPSWYPEYLPPYNSDMRMIMKVFPEDDATYKKIMSSVRPYVDEKFQSWILGSRNFDSEYAEFKKELEKRGINDAIAILQKAYDFSYVKK